MPARKQDSLCGCSVTSAAASRVTSADTSMSPGSCSNFSSPERTRRTILRQSSWEQSEEIRSRKRTLSAVAGSIDNIQIPTERWHGCLVHFASEPIILGYADANYDRRSIKVDLSRTPYALFHKDFYLLNRPEEYQAKMSTKENADHISDEDALTEGDESSSEEDSSNMIRMKRLLSLKSRPNFTGVWKRSAVEGFVELLILSGVPKSKAHSAASRRPIHIIDHDDDYFRLIVKNGLVKVDKHYIIGDVATNEAAGTTTYKVALEWGVGSASGKKESLVLTSVSEKDGTEITSIRTLEDNGETLVQLQIIRKPATGEEARAKHVFKRCYKAEEEKC